MTFHIGKLNQRTLYHYGIHKDGIYHVATTKRTNSIGYWFESIPKKANTFPEALCIILFCGRNLMRVSGYKCENHKKIHRYTFHNIITMCPGLEKMYGFDKKQDVIDFANRLIKK
jgi:hypothetical protein